MNVPNQLTVSRLGLTALFVAALSFQVPAAPWIALTLFALAALTDFLDGYLARRRNQITEFGKLMDPLADKILVAAGFVMLVERTALPGWAVVLILSREFLVTGLRLVAAARGVVLAAESLGKHKTVWQIGTILFYLTWLGAAESGATQARPGVDRLLAVTGHGLLGITLFLTVGSGVRYFAKNRERLPL